MHWFWDLVGARSAHPNRSLFPARVLRYYLYRTLELRQNKELVFVSLMKGFDKDIYPATVSFVDQADFDPVL